MGQVQQRCQVTLGVRPLAGPPATQGSVEVLTVLHMAVADGRRMTSLVPGAAGRGQKESSACGDPPSVLAGLESERNLGGVAPRANCYWGFSRILLSHY